MGHAGTEERHGDPLRKLTTLVPPGARPGETQLSVDLGGPHELLVKVPLEALPGDKLLLTQGADSSWACSIVRKKSSSAHVQQAVPDLCGSREKRIQLLVPPKVTPGESKLAVPVGDGSRVQLTVPPAARPGDVIELRQEAAGLGAASAESWQCKLVCDKVARGKDDGDLEHISQLRPLRAPPPSADEAFRKLFAAVRAAGGAVSPKLRRGSAPPLCIPGILAAEPIEAGEELCRIPHRLHISARTVQEMEPELWRLIAAQTALPEARRREFSQSIYIAQLLHRAEDRAAGGPTPTSRLMTLAADPDVCAVWERYADGLLSEDFASHPYRRAASSPDAVRTALEPSTEAEYYIEMAKDLHSTYGLLTTHCSEALAGRWPEFGMFFRARLCMLTRVFQATDDSTLVPVVDLFNHAPSMKHGVAWRWDEQERAMVVTARRAHAAGEELFCSYGLRSNLLLYRTYGFTHSPEVEPAWTYMVWPDHARAIFDMFLPLPEGQSRLQVVLDSKHLEESLCDAMNEVCRNGRDAAEFLRLVCARCLWPYERDPQLRPALEALGRARRRDPTSFAWWSELGEVDRGLAEEEFTRIKMCEYLCLTAHADAVDFAEGKLPESQCLQGTEHLRGILTDALKMLKEERAFRLKHVLQDPLD